MSVTRVRKRGSPIMKQLQKVLSWGQSGLMTLALLVCTLTGCLVPSREAVKDPGWSTTGTETTETERAPEGQGLIKPFIPPDTPESEEKRAVDSPPPPPPDASPSLPAAVVPSPLGPAGSAPALGSTPAGQPVPSPTMPDMDIPPPVSHQPSPPPSAPTADTAPAARMESTDARAGGLDTEPPSRSEAAPIPQSETVSPDRKNLVKPESRASRQAAKAPPRSREWEDQKVRNAAMEMARGTSKVKKGKFCYSVKHDEWWVILYEDAGNVYDVKQFVWNRDRERLEPHLVLKTIGKNRLEEHLISGDGDKACEPFEPAQ
jgi:hypothetical protein